MKIETKYDAGQKVWFLDNKNDNAWLIEAIVKTVKVESNGFSYDANYVLLHRDGRNYCKPESLLFASQEELLADLQNRTIDYVPNDY